MDMNSILGKVKEMQAKMQEAQENLANITVEAESGGGMVKVKVDGTKKVVGMEIDEALINPDDKQMLVDLVVAAVNKGVQEADAKAKEEMKNSTSSFMPNIPGFDLGSMGL